MKQWVLLKSPNSGYYIICIATGSKHFSLEDKGWNEVHSGSYEDCFDLLCAYEHSESNTIDIINIYCEKTYSLIQTTHECLNEIIGLQPDYLKDKEFL